MMERDAFSVDAQRYLDGEPFGELGGGERAVADRLVAEVRDYTARLEAVAPSLDEAVMAVVRRRARVPRRRGLGWLLAPRTVRVRPVWVPVLAAAAALALWLSPRAPAPPVPVAVRRVADTVFVRFELTAPQARSV